MKDGFVDSYDPIIKAIRNDSAQIKVQTSSYAKISSMGFTW